MQQNEFFPKYLKKMQSKEVRYSNIDAKTRHDTVFP